MKVRPAPLLTSVPNFKLSFKAFMSGKLKITGNILAAQKLQQLWSEEAPRGSVSIDTPKEQSVITVSDSHTSDDRALFDVIDFTVNRFSITYFFFYQSIPISGLKSDIVFTVFKNRMHEEPDLVRRLRVIFQFNITINGKIRAVWSKQLV